MSKHVLILGAGLVSQPLIDYLFERSDYRLTVADLVEEKALKAIKDHPRGQAAFLDVKDETLMEKLVAAADLVVSLLPYIYHAKVAKLCLKLVKPMVNASYVSPELSQMDAEAKAKGLLFLCEIGLDPGIDHMSAMKIIHSAQKAGGTVAEFLSVCGGLPAPDANDNPFGYKFSWSPKGVLMAGNNSARYIADGAEKRISTEELFHSTTPMEIDGQEYEAYPNRDSTNYQQLYGLDHIDLLMRGTLRYAGWHHLILALKALHLLGDHELKAGSYSFPQILAMLNDLDVDRIEGAVAQALELSPDDSVLQALSWLGLFDQQIMELPDTNILDLLAQIMSKKMSYREGERDMVILQHQFKINYPGYREELRSTLIDYGVPHGASAMARTVSLPLAIAVKLILEEQITLTGVQIPVHASIYEPVLAELETMGIHFHEEVTRTTI